MMVLADFEYIVEWEIETAWWWFALGGVIIALAIGLAVLFLWRWRRRQ